MGGARGHGEAGAPGPKRMAWGWGAPLAPQHRAGRGLLDRTPLWGRPSSSHLLCLPSEAALASGSAPSPCPSSNPHPCPPPAVLSSLCTHPFFFPLSLQSWAARHRPPRQGEWVQGQWGTHPLTYAGPFYPGPFSLSVLGSDLPSGLEPRGLGFGGVPPATPFRLTMPAWPEREGPDPHSPHPRPAILRPVAPRAPPGRSTLEVAPPTKGMRGGQLDALPSPPECGSWCPPKAQGDHLLVVPTRACGTRGPPSLTKGSHTPQ